VAYFGYHPILGLQCLVMDCEFEYRDIDIARAYEMDMIRYDRSYDLWFLSRLISMSQVLYDRF
jgi:hypothetical protein